MNYGKKHTAAREKMIDAKSVKIRKKIFVTIGKAFLVLILFLVVVGISTGVGVWKGIVDSAPDISAMDVRPTGYSTTVLSDDGEEIARLVASGANRKYVTIDEVPQKLQDAVVAIEDERFYEHNGVDPKGMIRALFANISSGRMGQGASTITQQLIKNNVLKEAWENESKSSSGIEKIQRKLQEQYLAVKLEEQVNDKSWILENYLNTINLGANTLGVQAASEKYFGKDVSELSLSECAVIAGITKNPAGYNPIRHPEENDKRRKLVLDNMLRLEFITKAEYEEALEDNVYERIAEYNTDIGQSMNSYFVDALIDNVFDDLVNLKGYTEIEAYKAIYRGGLTIYSTQDLGIQQICDEEANRQENYYDSPKYSFFLSFQVKKAEGTYKSYSHQTMLSYYKKETGNENFSINYDTEEDCYAAIEEYKNAMLEEGDSIVEGSESVYITLQPQVAMTVMEQSTGEVKAIVGGRGEKVGNRTWNRATNTTRQAGSTFKVVGCYAAALDEKGLTLATVQDDAPFTAGTKSYRNADSRFRGFASIREGIYNSINIVAVKTLQQIGVPSGYEYAEDFGITTLSKNWDMNLGLALGGLTNGVKNLELTAAYAAVANGGEYREPKFYTKVVDHNGKVILDIEEDQETHQVVKETTAWILTDAMKDTLTMGTSPNAYFGPTMAQAGKSGTTTSKRDALFAGYTPYYTCVIWGGFDDNSIPVREDTTYPKRLWKVVMGRIHENLEYRDFEMPEDIITSEVCRTSGLLPIEGVCDKDPRGSQVYTEYFVRGTVPTETCNHHIALDICKDSGKVANALFCPADHVEKKVFLIGGSEGTEDTPYLATDRFQQEFCDLHNADTVIPKPEIPDIDIPGDLDTGDGSGSTSGGGGESEGGTSGGGGMSGGNGTRPIRPNRP